MPDTPNLGLPLIAAAQAQKHVTHNEALLAIDALLQCTVLRRDLATPPTAPAEGARYIVAAAPTGAWVGRAGQIAAWREGVWSFHAPAAGFIAYVLDEARLCLHDGSAWAPVGATLGAVQNLGLLGLGAIADATNPFPAKPNTALWTARTAAEGGDGDLRYTLNKEAAADVVSLLFQTGFSGRCEIGLVGTDALTLKVSPNGSTWVAALAVDAAGTAVAPGVDNAVSSGKAGARWSTVYAASGAISTSDARAKTVVEPLAEPEIAAARELAGAIGSFRFLDAVARKGPAARTHIGLTVQEVLAILTRHGLDPFAYGFVCHDSWDAADGREAGDLYGIRADELLLLIARGFGARLDALEARLSA